MPDYDPPRMPNVSALPSHTPFDISIAICTRDRSVALRQILMSLSSMRVPETLRYEVIIVDNGSTDDTPKIVVEFTTTKFPLTYIYEKKPGLSQARNAALSQAQGRFIFFTDDDCMVSADWLEVGFSLLSHQPRQVIGGRVDLHDSRDLPITIRTDIIPAELTSINDLFGFMHGCNMIFGRCVVDEIGMFDPALGAGTRSKAADDTDFIYRAFRAEIPVRYCPQLRVAHNHGRRDPVEGQRLVRAYLIATGALTFKHLLHGRLDLLKVVYWNTRSAVRAGRPSSLPQYIAGAFAYLRS